jgi:hypothetical protein
MSTHVATEPARVSFMNVKFFLVGLGIDLAILGLYFLFFFLASAARVECDSCTGARWILECLKAGLGLGLFYLMFVWTLLIPLLAVPLVVGFVLDYRNAWRDPA